MGILMVDIVAGAFREGDRLPSESDLVQQFGVSRGIVREALRGLEERGLVTVRHGRGTTVSPARYWNLLDSDVLAVLLQSRQSASVLSQFIECRKILEVEAAGLAAERATGQHLTELADALARMTAAAERAAVSAAAEDLFHEADIAFHGAVFGASGNRVLSRLVQPVQRALIAARRPLAHPEARLERALPEHKRILSAIASRDPAAARAAMADHIATAERYLREYTESLALGANEESPEPT
jgi:DNA-binding FadR family transcriptional regulator